MLGGVVSAIVRDAVARDSLLATYRGGVRPERWTVYQDCYSVPVDRVVSLSEFIFEFYSSPVFRIERWLLRIVLGVKASDADLKALAAGVSQEFSVWRVADRTVTQLLLCDRFERTRSWLRVLPLGGGRTLLQFGSAVAARRDSDTGALRLGTMLGSLLWVHALYSRALLWAALIGIRRAERLYWGRPP